VDLNAKATSLQSNLRGLGRLLVAYSGGVDSAYLAFAARQTLGSDMLAVNRRLAQPAADATAGCHRFRAGAGHSITGDDNI